MLRPLLTTLGLGLLAIIGESISNDIEAIQAFVMNGLLGVLINLMALMGMIAVICSFILGSSGKLVHDDFLRREVMETSFDRDRTFMLIEIAGDQLYFQTIAGSGETVDSGAIVRQGQEQKVAAGSK